MSEANHIDLMTTVQPKKPRLFVVSLLAGGVGGQNVHMYQYAGCAYDREGAIKDARIGLDRQPTIKAQGETLGGWNVAGVVELKDFEVQRLFAEASTTEQERQAMERKSEKNLLMRTILEKKDTELLHRLIAEGKFEQHDIDYMHAELTEIK